ncbi:hypothetical protein [Atopobium fossor]|uniref:hypothetical protein n=1 Tax=Atopobium fossor TaxID=39487 RepID=UPI00048968EC|nr:hypothetical protein [Atopobium fossor]
MMLRKFLPKQLILTGILAIFLIGLIAIFGHIATLQPAGQKSASNQVTAVDKPSGKKSKDVILHKRVDVSNEESRLSKVVTESGEVSTYYEQNNLLDSAQSILKTYQMRGDCVLVRSGYLDLQGNVWSCTTCGKGWVDVVFVSQQQKNQCEVKTVRLTTKQWASQYSEFTKAA